MPQNITLLGATGSIGHSTLQVIAKHPQNYRIFALSAYRQADKLIALCQQYRPQYAVLVAADASQRQALQAQIPETQLLIGEQALVEIAQAPEVDTVMAAIVGAAGLVPTLAAAQAGKRVLLANKEALVMAGELFMHTCQQHQAQLLPIDSEHNAIFQCLPPNYQAHTLQDLGIEKILLTASGGPFRTYSAQALLEVTPEQALAHPNWSMGPKISIDSATLMNKGLELIEACWLFTTTPEYIQVVIHPQSVIHSMVAYRDGSVLAQLGQADMRTPIAHALAWPKRIDAGVKALDWWQMGALEFAAPDTERFPCLALAQAAFQAGGCHPAHLNAANEEAVSAFLQGQIGFTQIAQTVDAVLQQIPNTGAHTLETILAQDQQARRYARQVIAKW
ncbi:1-deoxy-D-xylulose-5-phosphate reductoisomerase [Allopseudospirillum japonicum]|uniref:1-deoxy-D-xylulose 5-phosphate reductoisomerase n=1 Tax=Allopseudospirillum japonicum TaxID=64971 RepID=A0A1H6RH90_9GAMM|nr:1-deoxy-D-xylulose-5-phosphate reductoisomerase [Allopseudospirillum japonicum]SEI51210.1 1-deoxy-D-xylulose-5-phosphate reductoisomerase [Allopseudospirillum japonicum]